MKSNEKLEKFFKKWRKFVEILLNQKIDGSVQKAFFSCSRKILITEHDFVQSKVKVHNCQLFTYHFNLNRHFSQIMPSFKAFLQNVIAIALKMLTVLITVNHISALWNGKRGKKQLARLGKNSALWIIFWGFYQLCNYGMKW